MSTLKIHVLLAQRQENYPGEYAPDALAVMSEAGQDENPEYLEKEKASADASAEFESTALIAIDVDRDAIMRVLRPAAANRKGAVSAGGTLSAGAVQVARYVGGDKVRWQTEPGGDEKVGSVHEVVPANRQPHSKHFDTTRDHESYIVWVPTRGMYWPQVAVLKRA